MNIVEQLLKDIINLPYEKKVSMAEKTIIDTIKLFKKYKAEDETIKSLIIGLLILFTSSDMELSEAEGDLINIITKGDITPEILYEYKKYGNNPEFIESLEKVLFSIDRKDRTPIIFLGILILSCDSELTIEEQELINRIAIGENNNS